MTCENKDVVHMKIKYKNAGALFECFPETDLPGKKPGN
jgi:hypothetical protein